MSYYNNGPTSNREALGMSYDTYHEYLNNMNRFRRNATIKRKSLARNALAAQMITTGRGPKPPAPQSMPPLPIRIKPSTPTVNHGSELYEMNNMTRDILKMLADVQAPSAEQAAPAPAGGAGAASANTSHLEALPNVARNKIASFLSGVERNHLKPIKTKIASETAKLYRKRKTKTRRS